MRFETFSVEPRKGIMNKKIEWVSTKLLELFFPQRCPFCDGVLGGREKICKSCRKKICYVQEPRCYRCGKGLAQAGEELCKDCQTKHHDFTKGYSLYTYESVKDSLYRFKFHDRPAYASVYAWEVRNHLPELKALEIECIIPVPMYPPKERRRGYNQAGEIAKYLGKELAIPVNRHLLVRKKKTRPMKELGPAERQINLRNAFHIRANDVKLRSILLVDDIYTTGATLDACSRILRASGVQKIYFVTLASGKGI